VLTAIAVTGNVALNGIIQASSLLVCSSLALWVATCHTSRYNKESQTLNLLMAYMWWEKHRIQARPKDHHKKLEKV
jgi:hypothetical protein